MNCKTSFLKWRNARKSPGKSALVIKMDQSIIASVHWQKFITASLQISHFTSRPPDFSDHSIALSLSSDPSLHLNLAQDVGLLHNVLRLVLKSDHEGKQTWLQVLAIDNNSSVCHHKYKSELTGGIQCYTTNLITLLSWWAVFMDPVVGSRTKPPDVGIPVPKAEVKVKVVAHNSVVQ